MKSTTPGAECSPVLKEKRELMLFMHFKTLYALREI